MFIFWIIFLILVLCLAFYVLSEVCEDALTPSLEGLSESLNIPHDVACATFLAFGSSASEIAINTVGIFHGSKKAIDISVGALLGSALISFSILPSLCIYVSPGQILSLTTFSLLRDCGFFIISLVLVVYFSLDEKFDIIESCILLLLFIAYLVFTFATISCVGEKEDENNNQQQKTTTDYGTVEAGVDALLHVKPKSTFKQFKSFIFIFFPPFNRDEEVVKKHYWFFLITSIIYIVALSEFCLLSAIYIADELNISHKFVGLVFIAIASQIEDFAGSMAIARKGKGQSSLSNAVGSQVINFTLGFGSPFLAYNLWKKQPGVIDSEYQSGILVFLSCIFFLFCALVERMNMKLRTAIILGIVYFISVSCFWTISSTNA